MHILMKFLMNNLFLAFFIILSFSFSSDCISKWFSYIALNNCPIKINASYYNETDNSASRLINIYIDRKNKQLKFAYENKEIFLFQNKSMKLFKDTNQLYIDNPDNALSEFILSFFNDVYDMNNYNKISDLEYSYFIENLNLNEIYIKYEDSCENIKKIKITGHHQEIVIYDILIDCFDKDNDIDVFDISGDYFIYDLRR